MSRTTLYNFYIGLIPNLVNDLLFYIPKKEIPSEILYEFKELEEFDLLDSIYLFDEQKGPISYDKNIANKGLLKNLANLEKNIFSLVEKKAKVSNDEFKFLLKKYFVFVEALFYYNRWMSNKFDSVFGNDEKTKSLFLRQFENFKKHFETLIATFFDSENTITKESFSTSYIIDEFFPDLTKSFSKEKIADLITQPNNSIIISNVKIPKEKFKIDKGVRNAKTLSKLPILTEQEAEKILLQTYFGIE